MMDAPKCELTVDKQPELGRILRVTSTYAGLTARSTEMTVEFELLSPPAQSYQVRAYVGIDNPAASGGSRVSTNWSSYLDSTDLGLHNVRLDHPSFKEVLHNSQSSRDQTVRITLFYGPVESDPDPLLLRQEARCTAIDQVCCVVGQTCCYDARLKASPPGK